MYFSSSLHSDANPSKDSFLKLLTNVKIVLICFVIFTMSAGLGFLDTTLALYAIDKVAFLIEPLAAHIKLPSIPSKMSPSLCCNQFALSPGYVGLIALGLSLSYCIASPLFGYFTDKYPVSVKTVSMSVLFLYGLFSCVCLNKVIRGWLMVTGGVTTAAGFWLLGPVPFLHIPR